MKRSLSVVVVVLTCLLLCNIAQAQEKRHRVVIAVTSGDEVDWRLTAGNIRNLLASFPKDSVEIEVVAYGPGLRMLIRPSSVGDEIIELQARHVRFVACENSMRAKHVTTVDLLDGAITVPSGIVELVTKQEQGWAYIKAGR